MPEKQSIVSDLKLRLLSNPKLYNNAGGINSNLHKMLSTADKEIISKYVIRESISESVYCILNDLVDYPICKQCNVTPVSFFYNAKRGYSDFCSLQCSRKHNDSKTKRENTNIEKYGYKNPKQNADVVERTRINNIKKYGVISPTMTPEIAARISSTLKQTYSERKADILSAKEQTFNTKYGDHPNRTEHVKEKKKQQTQAKYGVDHTTQLDETKRKIRETMLEKYGSTCFFSSKKGVLLDKQRRQLISVAADVNFLNLLLTAESSSLTRYELSNCLNIPYPTLNARIRKHNVLVKEAPSRYGIIENDIVDFLKSCGVTDIIQHDRTLCNGLEIDIWSPEHKLAIELDGVYWHSEKFGKHKNYHLDKTVNCEKIGIQLLHIFDTEWTDPAKQKIWMSMIKSRLGLTQKVGARVCQVKPVSTPEAREFCEHNHLQGFVGGEVKLGLYHNNTLLQLIILSKPRYNKKYKYELIRAATLQNHTVVGGLGRLISYINGSIISYADRRYSSGRGYTATGFTEQQSTTPGYFYSVNGNLESRLSYQKHKLSQILPVVDLTLSEQQNMQNNGYFRVWDCGHKVFTLC